MAAGKGVHFWCFAQSISALDSTWGKEHRKTLLHLAELVQILGFPRTDAEGAEELSKAIGTATFEGQNRKPFGHHRREPHRDGQHPMAGRRVPVPGAREAGDTRRTHDPRTGPAICDRGAQGYAARRVAPSPRLLLAAAATPATSPIPIPFVLRKQRAQDRGERRGWARWPLSALKLSTVKGEEK